MTFDLSRLFADVVCELARAREKHPRDKAIPFTSSSYSSAVLGALLGSDRFILARAVEDDTVTHDLIIQCEFSEARAETDPGKRRAELVQVIACCIRAIEDSEATK